MARDTRGGGNMGKNERAKDRIDQYKFQLGEDLGVAIHDYLEKPSIDPSERAKQRVALSVAISEEFSSGDSVRMKNAICAILFAIERQVGEAKYLAGRAEQAAMWSMPFS